MDAPTAPVLAAPPCGAEDATWQTCGNTILGWVMGLGAVIAIIALLIIAGKMVQANLTGDPWIAARGMGELPWVLLGVVLLMTAAPLVTLLLGASSGNAFDTWYSYLEVHLDSNPVPMPTLDPSPSGPTGV
ncbi:hypothetical protein NI17_017180 [Thermobifida halotolerans]|uniref:Uncharacterized protein n=1 Tax=Thermobifida halotolerans TaxID=483545 RepID=A0AA97LV05_9ACTN|nr:hypothetical protein [Thermobifida halotolerans]UOE18540.1 hypothetical protein NI17_017180 [Thermobifida halotolerans]